MERHPHLASCRRRAAATEKAGKKKERKRKAVTSHRTPKFGYSGHTTTSNSATAANGFPSWPDTATRRTKRARCGESKETSFSSRSVFQTPCDYDGPPLFAVVTQVDLELADPAVGHVLPRQVADAGQRGDGLQIEHQFVRKSRSVVAPGSVPDRVRVAIDGVHGRIVGLRRTGTNRRAQFLQRGCRLKQLLDRRQVDGDGRLESVAGQVLDQAVTQLAGDGPGIEITRQVDAAHQQPAAADAGLDRPGPGGDW